MEHLALRFRRLGERFLNHNSSGLMARNAFSLGIDIGGTATKGVVLLGEKIVRRKVVDTPKRPDDLIETIKRFAAELLGDTEISCAGVGVAGRLDAARKEILAAPNAPAL